MSIFGEILIYHLVKDLIKIHVFDEMANPTLVTMPWSTSRSDIFSSLASSGAITPKLNRRSKKYIYKVHLKK